MMGKKFMFVISSMTANGAERVMSLLVNKASEQGHEVMLVLLSKNIVSYTLNPKVKVVYAGATSIWKRFMNLRKLIKSFRPDGIVSFLSTCNIYSCMATIGFDIPVIISERNDPIKDCPSKKRRIIRNWIYRLADGSVFQTEEAASYFSEFIKRKSIVIPNPVKDQLPFSSNSFNSHVVVAAGRLSKQKNYPMMLQAFKIFLKKFPDYHLHIYGDGEERENLVQFTQKLGIERHVQFEGLVLDLHTRIKDATMFVLSSDYEGISNSLLEALSMGLPCISTDCPCGGSRHLITNRKNGLLVPVGDVNAFSQAMIELADNRTWAIALGKEAVKTRFSHAEDKIVADYFNYIESVLNKNA